MKYCSHCGAEIDDDAVVCVHCGCKVNDSPATSESQDTLDMVIKVFMVICTVCWGFAIIPLAWCIPMTISVFDSIKNKTPIGIGMKICTLLFVGLIPGILLLCRKEKE